MKNARGPTTGSGGTRNALGSTLGALQRPHATCYHLRPLDLPLFGRVGVCGWGVLSRGAGSLGGEVVEVVASGVRALESSKSAPKRVPGPPRTGRDPSESRRSNSPTDLLPRCRRTLAFAGLRAGRPRHCGARRAPRPHARRVLGRAHDVPHRARRRVAARHGACDQLLGLPGKRAVLRPALPAALCVGQLPLRRPRRNGTDYLTERYA